MKTFKLWKAIPRLYLCTWNFAFI